MTARASAAGVCAEQPVPGVVDQHVEPAGDVVGRAQHILGLVHDDVQRERNQAGPGREIGGPAADRYDVGAVLQRPLGHAPPESRGRAGDEPVVLRRGCPGFQVMGSMMRS
jgi:hypothetical protein